MPNNMVINTSLSNGASVPAITENLSATYSSGQNINQLIVLNPSQQYASSVGFSLLSITPSGPVQLVATRSGSTLINQAVNQQTTIDDTVDVFNVVNNSTTATVSVRLVYTVASGSAPPQTSVVMSVNGKKGVVVLAATDIAGFATVATSGNYNDLSNKPVPYVLPVATASVLGGVKQGANVTIAVDGTISVAAPYALPIATATVLGGVKQGSNITIAGDGTISAVAGSYTLPAATSTTLGGVKQGSNVTIAIDGTISVAAAPVASVSGQTGAVVIKAQDNNSATGTSLIVGDGSGTGIIKLKTLVAGSNIALAADTNGNIQISNTSSTYTLPVATATVLGGVKQGSNVTIAGDGTISVAAPYTLPAATGATLGGVIAGTGLSVAGDGTLSVTALGGVSSFNTRTGAVTLTLSDLTTVGGAPLASPAFSGVPTAPTALAGTNTTQVATTAFVTSAVTSAAGVTTFNSRSGAVTLTLSDVTTVGGAQLASPTFTGTPAVPTAVAGTNTTQVASTAFVGTAVANGVAGLAPLASPTFTGVPTVPTAVPGTNTTQAASTAFVTAAVTSAAGVASFNSRTGAVTLTLGDVTTVGGAPLASPTFTGIPAAPTATAGTNTTQLATTAFVTAAVGAIPSGVTTFNTRSGAVTLQASDITSVGGALLASPTFTGVPAAPTAIAGTNTTQVATTAFVAAAVSAGTVASFNTRTGAVTLQASDITSVGGALLASPTFTGIPAAPTATAGNSTTQVATTAFVATSFAPLASPVLTGAPTAPTAAPGTNTTQLATTAFVAAAVSAGSVTSFNSRTGAVTLQTSDVTGVGGALLASPTFTGIPAAPTATAGTNTTQLATTAFVATSYAPLASPTFTGTPNVPNAAAGTNTTQAASTAFVYSTAQGSASVALTNANVTLTAAQYSVPVVVLTGTLTGNLTVTFPTTGAWNVYNNTTGAFTVTLSNGSGATLAAPQAVATDVISSGASGMISVQPAAITGRLQVAAESYTVTALGPVSGTQTLNMATASEWTMTITGATTIAFTNTLAASTSQVVYIRFTNAGSAAITWPASTKFAAGTAPTFTASGVDLVGVKYDTTTSTYMVFVVGLNLS